MEQLYPIKAGGEDERQKIDQVLDVVFIHFKRVSDRLVKLILQDKAIEAGKISVSAQ